MKNNYEVRGNVTIISIESKTHGSFKTLIDTNDLEKVKEAFSWYMYRHRNGTFYVHGYVEINGKRKFVRLHRYIFGLTDSNKHVDHIFHDTLDNRKEFLRIVSNAENHQNQRRRSTNTSGVTGVCWEKRTKKWLAQIMVDGKNTHLGTFDTKEQAIQTRLSAEKKYFQYKNSLTLTGSK